MRRSTRRSDAGVVRGAAAALALLALSAAAAAALWGCGATRASTDAPPTARDNEAVATAVPAGEGAQGQDGADAASRAGRGVTRIVFVDVGQGDAAVIRSGSWAGLIDGGPAESRAAVSATLRRLGVRRLSAVVVSHMHADHTGALPRLVRQWRPRTAYVAGAPTAALRRAFSAAGTRVRQVRRGQTLPAWGAATAEVLSPGTLSGDANRDSVVILLDAAGRRFLFTGDCTGPAEAAVGRSCARGPPLAVLKVAHHGSWYSTSSAFLENARPRVAVISVGPNPYGHPTRRTFARLRAAGAAVYTTWKNGSVTFVVRAAGRMSRAFTGARRPAASVRDARGGE